MRLGRLNQRVTLQERATTTLNDEGENTAPWSDLATVWAQAQPIRGQEYFAGGGAQQTADVRFRVRYRDDITPSMRVRWRGVLHDIVSVIDVDGRRQVLELMTLSGTRDAREDDETGVNPLEGALELFGDGWIMLGDDYIALDTGFPTGSMLLGGDALMLGDDYLVLA